MAREEDALLNKNNDESRGKMESASAKKLSAFGIDIENITKAQPEIEDNGRTDCYFIVQKSVLDSLFMKFLCPNCKEPGLCLELSSEDSYGFATKGKSNCSRCLAFTDNRFFCKPVGGSVYQGSSFDINIRSVLAFRGIGSGFSNIKQ